MKVERGYNWKTGVWKSIKNNLVIWLPAILAFLANVPPAFVPFASLIVYFIKNFIQYKPSE